MRMITQKIDSMNHPFQGIVVATGTMYVSLTSLMEFGTTILGFAGASLSFIMISGSFYIWSRKIIKGMKTAKNKKRRKSDASNNNSKQG